MNLKIYQIDAFTSKLFQGNPAAVCPLEKWPDDSLLQNIAMENNLSETAFYVRRGDQYQIRWFTPSVEVALCGHATLAAAYVIFNFENHSGSVITFESNQSGIISVQRAAEGLTLNFPADYAEIINIGSEIISCFNIKPLRAFKGKTDIMLVYKEENEIHKLVPDLKNIAKLACRGVIVTAPGKNSDFVSRFFAPQSGVDEDPVTGSAHTTLTPYWESITGKKEMRAIQLSSRRGELTCRPAGDRVEISGCCRLYMSGEIFVENN